MKQPTWYVYSRNFSTRQIAPHNVFAHSGLRKDIYTAVNQRKPKEEFAEILRRSLWYYYRSKAEWEILISPWCGKDNDEIKVDVYEQVMLNWDKFLEYTWNERMNIIYKE